MRILLYVLLLIIFVSGVSAFNISTFDDGTNEGYMLFNGSNNFTKYLSMPIGASITWANLTIRGSNGFGSVQATNTTTYAGVWTMNSGTICSPENTSDGYYSTGTSLAISPHVGYFRGNYTVPSGAVEVNVTMVGFQAFSPNFGLYCINQTDNVSQIYIYDFSVPAGDFDFNFPLNTSCYEKRDIVELYLIISSGNPQADWVYELGLNYSYNISASPENVTVRVNDSIVFSNLSVFDGLDYVNLNTNLALSNYTLFDSFVPVTFTSNMSGLLKYFDLFILYNNTLNITIFEEGTGTLITDPVSVVVQDESSEMNYTTTTGNLFVSSDFDGDYSVRLYSSTYAQREYLLTFAGGESLDLNAYLSPCNETVIFTFKDEDTNELLEGVSVTMQRMIDSVWTTVNSKFTDVTGRVQFVYVEGARYRFVNTLADYATKIFILDPILFETYTVLMSKSQAYGEDIDYFGVTMIHNPHQFFNDRAHNFTFLISNPPGMLENYGFNITYPNGTTTTQSRSGTTAHGESWELSMSISDALISDRIVIEWYYDSSLGDLREFRQIYTIGDYTPDSGTWLYNQKDTFGMGLLERVLICVLVAIIVGGFLTLIAGAEVGGTVGLFVMGLFAYVLAINVFLILLSVLVGFLIIARRSSD